MAKMQLYKLDKGSGQKGAAAVETGLTLFVLVLLTFGIIELGVYLFNKQVLTNATREGARVGVVVRSPVRDLAAENSEIQAAVHSYADQHLVTFGTKALPTVVVTPGGRCLEFNCEMLVASSFQYQFLFLSAIGFGPRTIQAFSRMRME